MSASKSCDIGTDSVALVTRLSGVHDRSLPSALWGNVEWLGRFSVVSRARNVHATWFGNSSKSVTIVGLIERLDVIAM